MKSRIIFFGFVISLLLVACGGSQEVKQDVPAPQDNAVQQDPVDAPMAFPASLDDGDYYFQARAEQNPEHCEKIQDDGLKSECLSEFKN